MSIFLAPILLVFIFYFYVKKKTPQADTQIMAYTPKLPLCEMHDRIENILMKLIHDENWEWYQCSHQTRQYCKSEDQPSSIL
jgi:hypothetical protein